MHEGPLRHDPDPNAANFDDVVLETEDWLWADASVLPPDAPFQGHGPVVTAITRNALSVLGLCIVVVDSRLRVLHASAASRTHANRPCAGFVMTRRVRGAGTYLSLGSRADTQELRRLVAAAIAERPTSETREPPSPFHPLCSPRSICLISPVAAGLVDPSMGARFRNAALLIFKPFAAFPKPPPALLRTLFRFTQAEAEVASDLVGGTSAEEVARLRNVRLDTIRSQIRSILSKSGAPNLRAFENRIGSVMVMLPPDSTVLPREG